MKYDAFISYSHSADGQLAPAVQAGLQRLAKPWYRRRALRVFRDETGLSVNPHLWGSIAQAMGESRYFVLLASPDAAASPWVNREIAHWLATHPPETLLPVLTDGTLVWSATLGDFDPETSSALPAAMWGAYAEEPRHLDLRWAHHEAQLDLRHSQFRAQIATLAAPIHGVAREDLEGEDVRLHRRAMRLAGAAAIGLVALTVAAVIASFVAIGYAADARSNEARAQRNATRARTQELLARKRTVEVAEQKREAEQNATLAEQNESKAEQNEAKAEQNAALAEANATEAEQNANEAAANGAQAEENATRAAASATDAQRNAASAHEAAARADRNAADSAANAWNAELQRQEAVRERQRAEDNATVALSRQLAASALNDIDDNFDRALLKAVAAARLLPTAEARDALLHTLLARPELRLQFRPDRGAVSGLHISPSGNTIVTTNLDGGAEIRDAKTGKVRARLSLGHAIIWVGHDIIFEGDVGPEDQLAVSIPGVIGGEVDIVDLSSGRVKRRVNYAEAVPGKLAFAPDGKSLLVATGDSLLSSSQIEHWDLTGAPKLLESFSVEGEVDAIEFARDSGTYAWAETRLDPDGFPSRSLISIRQIGHPGQPEPVEVSNVGASVDALVFDANGGTLASITASGSDAVVLWDTQTGTRIATRAVTSGNVIAASPDQQLIAVGLPDRTVQFEDARTGEPVGRVPLDAPDAYSVYQHVFTPDGKALISIRADGGVNVVDRTRRTQTLGRRVLKQLPAFTEATLSPSGNLIATIDDNEIRIFDVRTEQLVRAHQFRSDGVSSPAPKFSPLDDVLAYGLGDEVFLVDIEHGTVSVIPAEGFYGIAFSHDGRTLAVTTTTWPNSIVRFWDVQTTKPSSREPITIPDVLPDEMALSPDGTLAVSFWPFPETAVRLYKPGSAPCALRGYTGTVLHFSPDGKILALQDDVGVVLLAVPSGTPVGPKLNQFRAGQSDITSVAIGADGGLLVTGGGDGSVQFWDVGSGSEVGPRLEGPAGEITKMAFTGSGQLVSLSSSPLEVRKWRIDLASLSRRACARANRDLTRSEWTQLIGDALPYEPPCRAILARS